MQVMGAAWLEPISEPPVSTSISRSPPAREVKLDPQQTNYLVNVLRLGTGAPVLLFNGRDGEFSASLGAGLRKAALLVAGARTRAQEAPPDVDYLFAPLKHARLDYMAQKAVEMGARRLRPVITRHTQVARVNLERLRLNAIEACEQCGVIWTPEIAPVEPLAETLKRWPSERLLVFCDEEAEMASPLDALASSRADEGVGLLSGPKAASKRTSARRSCPCPASFASASGRESCAPTQPRWPRWPSSRPRWATGRKGALGTGGGFDMWDPGRHFPATMWFHPRQR